MTALPEFLLARIAEDEEIANRARIYGWPGSGAKTVVDQVDRWSPARALAECEAKRRIVIEVVPTIQRDEDRLNREFGTDQGGSDDLLRLLALPYADHPDYDERWRP